MDVVEVLYCDESISTYDVFFQFANISYIKIVGFVDKRKMLNIISQAFIS